VIRILVNRWLVRWANSPRAMVIATRKIADLTVDDSCRRWCCRWCSIVVQ
jgi:hypothetical protein